VPKIACSVQSGKAANSLLSTRCSQECSGRIATAAAVVGNCRKSENKLERQQLSACMIAEATVAQLSGAGACGYDCWQRLLVSAGCSCSAAAFAA